MELTESVLPFMPDLARSHSGFHHTVDSALEILADLHISPARITIRMAGLGLPSFWVVEQSPAPGAVLGKDSLIALTVAGLGFFHALPVGMWDKGNEEEPGTEELLGLVDDPIQKAAHWVREGARLFDIRPENLMDCARWISLFGLCPDDWPHEAWYNLALLLPGLQRMAGKEVGVRFTLQLLLGLPVSEIRRVPSFNYLEEGDRTFLAERASRLGVDCIVGDRLENLARWNVVLGPVKLTTYFEFRREEKQQLLNSVLHLCLPCHQTYQTSWLVLDSQRAPRLGREEQNARLGINSYLGRLQ